MNPYTKTQNYQHTPTKDCPTGAHPFCTAIDWTMRKSFHTRTYNSGIEPIPNCHKTLSTTVTLSKSWPFAKNIKFVQLCFFFWLYGMIVFTVCLYAVYNHITCYQIIDVMFYSRTIKRFENFYFGRIWKDSL